MNNEADLRAKVHELFKDVELALDPALDRLIESGCGIVEDHDNLDSYLVARAFLVMFLTDQALKVRPTSDRGKELAANYSLF